MSSDSELTNANQIHTDGGSAVEGTVNTTGGDFVGRDQAIHGDKVGRDKITSTGDIHIHHYPSTPPAAAASDDVAPAPGDPPYQGMAYYDVADADRFFGREALTAELIDHLRQQPLLAVVGASGSGKSSLARAGVLPALQGKKPLIDGKQPPVGSARWAYHLITPTAHPLKTLAASLTPASESILAQAQLMDALLVEPRSLDLYAHRLVKGDQRLLLVVDQFEELFTLCKDEGEQQAFVDNLLYAATDDGVVTLVLTLRADFYHHCARFPDLRTALERQQRYIGAMTRDELRRAIEEPAKAGEWELQAGLVEQLLHDVVDEPGALPLLSHALLETWQRRRGRTLTLAGYRAAGGVQGAIAKTADDVYNRFTDEQQTIARIIFLRLTELGEGVQDTRRRVRPAELKLTQANADAVQQVLKTLADARLVTTAEDEVQVAHEALIRHWATLRAWLDDDREGHRIQRRLTEAANQWVEFGKEPSLLYRGVLLQQAREWLKNTIDLPNQIEKEFLEDSRKADEKERKRQRLGTRILAVLTLIALIAASVAWVQTQSANTINQQLQQTISETRRLANVAFSRQLAAQSTSELSKGQYESAILLALAAGHITDTLEAFSSIRTAIANPWHSRLVFYGHKETVSQANWNQDESKILTSSNDNTVRIWNAVTGQELVRLEGHTDDVTQASWNQDESKILTSSDDDTVRIWDAATGQELVRLEGHTGDVTQANWNQDESKVLTRSNDNTTRIWDAATGEELIRLEGHRDTISQASWNQDESKILTSSHDDTVSIWDVTTGRELVRLDGQYAGHSWNQDESKILTRSDDGTARIWNAATGQELVRLEGHSSSVYQASWNQDESKVLTRSDDGTARIWNAATGQELVRLEGHTRSVSQANWNQDESKILTRSDDDTVRIWNAVTGHELVRLEGHSSSVYQASWNQDESKILTRSFDTIIIWDAAMGKELMRLTGHTDFVEQATWSRDGSKILTSSQDNTARIWDVITDQELVRLDGDTGPVTQANWNQNESRILTRNDAPFNGGYIVRIWDAATGQELVKLDDFRSPVYQAIWNQNESKILTGSYDGTARIWDVATGRELLRLNDRTGPVYQAIWNQDESKILTSSQDNTARIWNSVTGQELLRLTGHSGGVILASWNQDESKVLTSSYDNTARIWDTVTGKELVRLEGHSSSVYQAIWNQSESKILTSSGDGTARIWDAVTGKELVRLEGRTGGVTQPSWNQDESKILTSSVDGTARIWDAVTGKELVRLEGHTDGVTQASWNQDESKILTSSRDGTARIWDAATGQELTRLEGHTNIVTQASWNQDESMVLTSSWDGTVRIWYVQMRDLLVSGCYWVPRNFTWLEWNIYIKEIQGNYRPTCPNTPIPLDAIVGIQEEARQQILAGQMVSGTQRLEELNGWLQVNGQFKNYGVDVEAFVAGVSVTATVEALPTLNPTPNVAPPGVANGHAASNWNAGRVRSHRHGHG